MSYGLNKYWRMGSHTCSYLPPVMLISVSRLRVRRTGRSDNLAATAAATELKTLRVSLPPKPPPILFILTTTRASIHMNHLLDDAQEGELAAGR